MTIVLLFYSIDGLHFACHETGGWLRKSRRILKCIKKW